MLLIDATSWTIVFDFPLYLTSNAFALIIYAAQLQEEAQYLEGGRRNARTLLHAFISSIRDKHAVMC